MIDTVEFKCDICGTLKVSPKSHYEKNKLHFCKRACYTEYQKRRPAEEHPGYKGGRYRDRVRLQSYPSVQIPITKRICPVCPGKKRLGHCWGDVNAPE